MSLNWAAVGKIFNIAHIVATDAAPILKLIGSATNNDTLNTVAAGIMVADQVISGPSMGAQKKQLVTAFTNAVHPGLDQDALGSSIDGLVAAINQLNAAAASVPAPPPKP